MSKQVTIWRRTSIVLILCASLLLIAHEEYRRAQPRMVLLDIGQGDAIYIRTPSGQDLLIDAGRGQRAAEQLSREMPFSDRTIEIAIATHFDADHIGGFEDVFDQYRVERFATNGATPTTDLGQDVIEEASSENAQLDTLLAGARLSDDSYVLDILWPKDSSEPANEGSIVALLQTAVTSIMLTGDAEQKAEHAIVESGANLHADILKVGHHGSKTSSTQEFIDAIGATRALISVGASNRYGHPTDEVLERLRTSGYEIERTDQHGSITVPL